MFVEDVPVTSPHFREGTPLSPTPNRQGLVSSSASISIQIVISQAENFQETNQDVICKSCKERFNQIGKIPRLLPCFHTICEGCLYREEASACPICHVKYEIGVNNLKVNFYVNKMVQIYHMLESELSERLKCIGCNRAAHFRCMKCSENYCRSHADFHHKSRATHDHNIIAVKDVAQNIRDCDKSMCSLCCITQHRTHSTCSLKNAGSRAKRELGELGPKASKQMSTERQKLIQLRQLASTVNRDHEAAKRQLKEFCERIVQNIRNREDELLDQLNAHRNNYSRTINAMIKTTEDKLKMVDQSKAFAEKIKDSWSEVEILGVRQQIVARLKDFEEPDTTEDISKIYDRPVKFSPSGEDDLVRSIWSFKNRHLIKLTRKG